MPCVINADAPRTLRLGPFEVGRAPEGPGIYAWYLSVPFGEFDWQPLVQDGVDQAVESFLLGILRYSDYYGPESLELKARAVYDAEWRGSITAPGMRADIDRLQKSAEDVNHRRVLVTLLSAAIPDFASPAYIGVAVDLRARLKQHLADYEKAREALKKSPGRASELQWRGSSLGVRLAGAGVPMEHLSIALLPVDIPDLPEKDAREAAEITEWVLQRIFQPTFGRR